MLLNEETLVREVVKRIMEIQAQGEKIFIPVGISNHHVHLCQADVEKLFGQGYQLKVWRELSQPGYYAAEETVVLVGPKGVLAEVRVLGPPRKNTQVELLIGDGYRLGLELPVRESGSTEASPCLTIVGPKGAVTMCHGVMAAARHIHMNSCDAQGWRIHEGELVRVRTTGERSVVFNNVRVRIGDRYITELHLDIEEANAANLRAGDQVELLLESDVN